MKKHGFTLAEVLLTLAIIGVIAALTIPAVVTKVQQDQYVVGLKKAYNTLKSVEREAIQENGPISSWNWTTLNVADNFNTYFKPYFDILKDCGATTDSGCFHGTNEVKNLSGIVSSSDWNVTTVYKFITSDGIAYSYTLNGGIPPTRRAYFVVDVNGKKGPNISGRDIFAFSIFNMAGLKPDGVLSNGDETVRITADEINAASTGGCNPNGGSGSYCPAKVLAEGAMNY